MAELYYNPQEHGYGKVLGQILEKFMPTLPSAPTTGETAEAWQNVLAEPNPEGTYLPFAPNVNLNALGTAVGGTLNKLLSSREAEFMQPLAIVSKPVAVAKGIKKEIEPILGKLEGLEIRQKFGEFLTPESKKLVNYYGTHRGEQAIHFNSKTGLSIDFSTNCPKRLSGAGP